MVEIDYNARWADKPEQIWVVTRVGDSDVVRAAYSSEDQAEGAIANGEFPWGAEAVEVTLHRPSLQPIYGGPTLLETLWNEMDRLMEALMTGADAEDGGDRYRAQELAWVIAIVTNAYSPSVDQVRAEAMRRWKAAEAEADAQERALDPDPDAHAEEQQHQWDAAGVNGYEL